MSDGIWFLEGVESIVRMVKQQRENARNKEYDPALTERIVKHILDLAKWRAEELVAKETHRLRQRLDELERRVRDLELEV